MKHFGWMDFIFKGQGQVKRDAEKQEAKGDERMKDERWKEMHKMQGKEAYKHVNSILLE